MALPRKGKADVFVKGDFNAVCSICGRKEKASRLIKNWQGLYRHDYCNEPRQPQDFAHGIKEDMSVPFVQMYSIKSAQFCTLNGISAVPEVMTPGCSIPNRAQFDPEMYNPGPVPPYLYDTDGNPILDSNGGGIIVR